MNSIKKFSIRLGAALALLIVFVIVINFSWFDETLRPEVQALRVPEAVPLNDNAWTLIMGMSGPEDRDPQVEGERLAAAYRAKFAAGERASLGEQVDFGNPLDEAWQELYPALRCSSRRETGCFAKLLTELEVQPINNPRLLLMLDRYQRILSKSTLKEIDELDAWTELPDYGVLMNLSRIHLANSYLSGTGTEYLRAIERDYRFWTMALGDGKLLISKMVAVAGIWTDLQFSSELVKRGAFDEADLYQLGEIFQPLDAETLDIGGAVLGELRLFLNSNDLNAFAQNNQAVNLLVQLALQENATFNEYYESFVAPALDVAQKTPTEFFEYVQHNTDDISANEIRVFPPTIYNLGGKLLSSSMHYGATDYVARVHDLNAMIYLLRAQIARSTDREGGSSEQWINPFSGKPFVYDAETNRLGFECLRPENFCQVDL